MEDTSLNFIFRRRSVRKFTDQKLQASQIKQLLQAAMAAPTAMNIKPWKFVVIQDPQRLNDLRKALPFGKMEAPCAIIVCGDLNSYKRPLIERFWIQDCSAATENILLAAVAIGLGSVWCGVHPLDRIEKRLRAIADIPQTAIPLNVIYLGYPAELKEARTQFSSENVFSETFGNPWDESTEK